MTTIYQWSLVIHSTGRTRVVYKATEARETTRKYHALEDVFLNNAKDISKNMLNTVVSKNVFPTYSSLDPNEEIAFAKLTEWYENLYDSPKGMETLLEMRLLALRLNL